MNLDLLILIMIAVSSHSVSCLFTRSRYGYVQSVIGRLMQIGVNRRGLVHRFNNSLVSIGALVVGLDLEGHLHNSLVMDTASVLA
jgi:hypothetical protein